MACEGIMPSKESQRGKNMCSLPHVWKLLDWSTGWRLPEARVGWAHEECWERGLQRISLQLEIWLQVLKQFHWTAIICHREIVCKRRVSRCGRLYHLSYFKKLPQPLQLSTATTLISQPPAAWRWDPPPAVTLRRHSLSTKYTQEGFLISLCYSLELCIQMGISFLFSFAFRFPSFHSYL